MSFAKLLGNLETSANIAVKSSKKRQFSPPPSSSSSPSSSNNPSSSQQPQPESSKRTKFQNQNDVDQTFVLPRDIKDLSVTVSFLGIGAQKAGTSWLHKMLSVHEDLSLPEYVLKCFVY